MTRQAALFICLLFYLFYCLSCRQERHTEVWKVNKKSGPQAAQLCSPWLAKFNQVSILLNKGLTDTLDLQQVIQRGEITVFLAVAYDCLGLFLTNAA